jgi:hypothetical protein
MAREFTKNMFIMLLSIMIGAVIITYFMGDIVYQSNIRSITTEHTVEIETITGKNINFTNNFLKSSVLLDGAREDRAFGNYNFDLAFLWYTSALSEKNSTNMEIHKTRAIDNCSEAMPNYINSHYNFLEAKKSYTETKGYTTYDKYLEVLDLYVKLTDSGAKLTLLRYNASQYLKIISENLTYDEGIVTYLGNMTELLILFNQTIGMYGGELAIFEEILEEIDEYEFFEEIR